MFDLINRAKKQQLRPLANIAFAILINKTLHKNSGLSFMWEKSSSARSDADIFKDLLVITDGRNYACLPAPFLKEPNKFRSMCVKEYTKLKHNRKVTVTPVKPEDYSLLQKRIVSCFNGNIQELLQTYFVPKNKSNTLFNGKGDCLVCNHFDRSTASCNLMNTYPKSSCSSFNVNYESKLEELAYATH